jgi:LCP family protein required for cell wall assembly
MSKKTTLILIVILEIVVILIIGIAWQKAVAVYKNSLAAPLVLDVQPTPTGELSPTKTAQPQIVPVVNTCGQSGGMTLLILSRDLYQSQTTAGASWPYGADLIRFIRIDFSQRTVRMIAVPRDLWVSTPHLDFLSIKNKQLGLIFFEVEQNTSGTRTEKAVAAVNAVAQSLYDNFAVTADHYVYFDMQAFDDAVEKIGGVDVNIPQDLTSGGYSFSAGLQHLDAESALIYARLLPGNEITEGADRFDRQNIVLKALWKKILQPENIVKIPGLAEEFSKNIITDLSPSQIMSLTCMIDKIPEEQVTLVEVEETMVLGPGPENSILPNVDMIKQFLQEQLAP